MFYKSKDAAIWLADNILGNDLKIVKRAGLYVISTSFQGYSDISESPLLQKNGDYDICYSPATFRYNFSLQVHAAPFQWKRFIFVGKKTCHIACSKLIRGNILRKANLWK